MRSCLKSEPFHRMDSPLTHLALSLGLATASCLCACRGGGECAPQRGTHPVSHVFFIGLDGWGSYSVDSARMPHVKALMENGAYTLRKRCVLPSHSATNWASLFTGVGPEAHGFWACCSSTPDLEPLDTTSGGIFPTVFTRLRQREPRAELGCLHEWDGIAALVDTASCSFHRCVAQEALCAHACAYILDRKPRFAAFIFDDPDHMGHRFGHGSAAYYEKLEQLDAWVGSILEAIRDAGILEESVVVISSDHGGIGQGHGGIDPREVLTPLLLCGKGVRKGFCFDGTPTVQYDVAALLADLLGFRLPCRCAGRVPEGIFIP